MNRIKNRIFDIISFCLGIVLFSCITVLADTCSTTVDATGVDYSNTDLKTEIDSLATSANSIENDLLARFNSNSISYFNENSLQLRSPAISDQNHWVGLEIYYNGTAYSSLEYGYDRKMSANATILAASDGTNWGDGRVDLLGNPVAINGSEVGLKIKYTDVSIGNITLTSTGYYDITNKRPSGLNNFLFASIKSYSSNNPKAAFNIVIGSTYDYIIGTANQVISGLNVRYFYTD